MEMGKPSLLRNFQSSGCHGILGNCLSIYERVCGWVERYKYPNRLLTHPMIFRLFIDCNWRLLPFGETLIITIVLFVTIRYLPTCLLCVSPVQIPSSALKGFWWYEICFWGVWAVLKKNGANYEQLIIPGFLRETNPAKSGIAVAFCFPKNVPVKPILKPMSPWTSCGPGTCIGIYLPLRATNIAQEEES